MSQFSQRPHCRRCLAVEGFALEIYEAGILSKAGTVQRRKPGRPTRAEADIFHNDILDKIFDLMALHGYEHVTLSLISRVTGITRRTLYLRYGDKKAIFYAAVERAISRFVVADDALSSLTSSSLEDTLTEVALIRFKNATSPTGQSLLRLIASEANQFHDLYGRMYELSTRPTVDFIAGLFRRHNELGITDVDEPDRAARVFMTMAVGGPVRLASWGIMMSPQELEDRIRYAARLFLNGVLRRQV
jgi:TetR/AcrR family transcriptional regulator, mexJK operon transcriptional repressor